MGRLDHYDHRNSIVVTTVVVVIFVSFWSKDPAEVKLFQPQLAKVFYSPTFDVEEEIEM